MLALPINPYWDQKAMTKVYLSDMQEIDPQVGWGKFGKNGMLGFGFGNNDETTPIIVAGQKFPKGLSTHPPDLAQPSVKYRLDRNAKILQTDVGFCDLPDKLEHQYPVQFQIIGDGRPLWISPLMKSSGTTYSCRINVENVEVLELQARCPANLEYCCAVWLDPYVLASGKDAAQALKPAFPKVLALPIDPKWDEKAMTKVYLSDMQEIDPKVGWGKFGKNGMMSYGYKDELIPIMVAGQAYPKGLSAGPPNSGSASVKYLFCTAREKSCMAGTSASAKCRTGSRRAISRPAGRCIFKSSATEKSCGFPLPSRRSASRTSAGSTWRMSLCWNCRRFVRRIGTRLTLSGSILTCSPPTLTRPRP